MAVYVDRANIRYGRMIMCHMIADTLDELHEMAEKIGVDRKWFQEHRGHRYHPHYDICLAKKRIAIANGAIELENYQLVMLLKIIELKGTRDYPINPCSWMQEVR